MRSGGQTLKSKVRVFSSVWTQCRRMTRLETRTKESTHTYKQMCSKRANVVKAAVLIHDYRSNQLQFQERGLSTSTPVGTRKMVNYI